MAHGKTERTCKQQKFLSLQEKGRSSDPVWENRLHWKVYKIQRKGFEVGLAKRNECYYMVAMEHSSLMQGNLPNRDVVLREED